MEIVALSTESVRGIVGASGPEAPESPNASDGDNRSWHDELRRAIRDPAELVAALELPPSFIEPARRAAASFPLFAPWPYVNRMV